MTIGIVLATPPGYSETFFTSKINGLKKNGFEVILFVQTPQKGFSLCKVSQSPRIFTNPVFQLFSSVYEFVRLIPHFKKVFHFFKEEKKEGTSIIHIYKKIYLNAHILKHKLDWLHFGFATQALGKEFVAQSIGAKMAVSFRGFDINVYPLKHPNCYDLLWQQVDKIHSISYYLLSKANQLGLPTLIPYQIIAPAVNMIQFPPEFNSHLQPPFSILTIARLNWIKGIDTAIDSMKLLDEKGINFTYTIIGSGTEKEKEQYHYQVIQLNLTHKINFIGKLSHQETIDYLKKADIYIQPSINEGFCNAVLEAQAMGKLCIATNTGGLTENIENNKTGWLIPKNNPEALANKIIEVVHLPNDKKQIISLQARERIKQHFTIKKQQEEFINFYND